MPHSCRVLDWGPLLLITSLLWIKQKMTKVIQKTNYSIRRQLATENSTNPQRIPTSAAALCTCHSAWSSARQPCCLWLHHPLHLLIRKSELCEGDTTRLTQMSVLFVCSLQKRLIAKVLNWWPGWGKRYFSAQKSSDPLYVTHSATSTEAQKHDHVVLCLLDVWLSASWCVGTVCFTVF